MAGAEVRQGFSVEQLVSDGETIVGVRGRDARDGHVEERARLVIGADGFRSSVATAVCAEQYETQPGASRIYFSHWSGLRVDSLEIHFRPGSYRILFPTNDGLTFVGVGWKKSEFSRIRSDVETYFMHAIDQVPELAERVRPAHREEPFASGGNAAPVAVYMLALGAITIVSVLAAAETSGETSGVRPAPMAAARRA